MNVMRLNVHRRYPEPGTLVVDHETYAGIMIHWETGWVFHAYFKQPARPSDSSETFTVVFQPDPSSDEPRPASCVGQAVLRQFYSQYRIEGIGELRSSSSA